MFFGELFFHQLTFKKSSETCHRLTRILGVGESVEEFWPESFLLLKLFHIFDWLSYFALHLLPAHKPLSFTQYLHFSSLWIYFSLHESVLDARLFCFPKPFDYMGYKGPSASVIMRSLSGSWPCNLCSIDKFNIIKFHIKQQIALLKESTAITSVIFL